MCEEQCVYLRDRTGKRHKDKDVYVCQRFDRCIQAPAEATIAGCHTCQARLLLQDADFAQKWIDPLAILDRRRERTEALRGLLAGSPSFMVCSGPSINDIPIGRLNKRGCFSLAVNNAAGMELFKPQAFVCSDPPRKFHHSIWFDPSIIKFIPSIKMIANRGKLRQKMPDGSFGDINKDVVDCPNIWGFKREVWFKPTCELFMEDAALWGNLNAGVDRTGLEKTVCTMLIAIRLLYYLGSRRIYLIGVDFWMNQLKKYVFSQDRTPEAIVTNNEQFRIVNKWLCTMVEKGVFRQFGLEIYNCNPKSGLRAFDHVPFDLAVKDARGICEDRPDLSGWYEK